jgi:hypothetical protein
MPKYHWLPFIDCFIGGSRSPCAFVVELGHREFSTTHVFKIAGGCTASSLDSLMVV